MKRIVLSVGAFALVAAVAAAARQDAPKCEQPAKEHQWLQQLVGEWDLEFEAACEPGKPPEKSRGTETVRAIGGFWVIAENEGKTPMGPFKGVFQLGFDAKKGKYVGTWIDTMQSALWTYEGELDKSGKVLTLNAEGDCPWEPGVRMKFRETLEVTGKDEKRFVSKFEKGGEWITACTITYKRRK